MEQDPGQDPEQGGEPDPRPDPEPGPSSSGSDDTATPGSDDDCVFGDWDGLEGTLGAARERAELLSAFAPGGAWDGRPPGPELAAALARAVGPQWRCGLATGPELIGLLRGMAALQSWAGAGLLGVVRALIRDDDLSYLGRSRHGDLPDEWDDSLVHEIALALAVSVPSAEKTTRAAWELGARLPGVELLLRDGTLDVPRARLVAEVFEDLSDEDCAKAEELLLPRLTGPPRKTWAQIEKLATAIAVEVDPGLAERRRRAAERRRARVMMFRERSGTAALSGRDLPTDEALAAFAHVAARAQRYKESGAFAGERIDRLRAAAYLDILNGVSAEDRIACGRLSPDDKPGDGNLRDGEPGDGRPGGAPDDGTYGGGPAGGRGPVPDDAGPGRSGAPGPRPGSAGGGPGPGGSDCPCGECDGRCAPPDDGDLPDEDAPDDPGGGGPAGTGNGGGGSRGGGGPGPGDDRPGGGPDPGDHGGGGPDGDAGPGPGGGDSQGPGTPGAPKPALTDLVLPLATLLGRARRPGEGHGLGALDPALGQALAAAAARSPATTLCVTVTGPDGIAIGHGCAKPGRRAPPPDGRPPPLAELPARVNLTITTARLAQLRASPQTAPPERPATGPPRPPGPSAPPQAPPPPPPAQPGTGWALARRGPGPPGDPDWCGPWALTLPTGLDYRVDLAPVPTYDCDHRNESRAYKPNATLRHLVQVRDCTCTFPTCNRHARESDFEHATPYDQGGRTCACNAGARSRKCHRVKQSPGWDVTQPKPGWHQWTTPRGRTYT
ncbi:MAG TPA: DUF222 domain-containing protein, partial [Streptosporangiaceae bacterium]